MSEQRIHGYLPLHKKPGYNANPNDWVRFTVTQESLLSESLAREQRLREALQRVKYVTESMLTPRAQSQRCWTLAHDALASVPEREALSSEVGA